MTPSAKSLRVSERGCACGYSDTNHCTHCDEHFVVVVLRELHEANCPLRVPLTGASAA